MFPIRNGALTMIFPTTRRLWSTAATCALLLTIPIGAAAGTPTRKLDIHLQQRLKQGSVSEHVIVRTKKGQRAAVARAIRQRGHKVYGDHPGIEAVSAVVSAETLRTLANNPAVESISIDANLDALDSGGKSSKSKPTSKSTSTSTSTPSTSTSAPTTSTSPPTMSASTSSTRGVTALLSSLVRVNYPIGSPIE